MGYIRRQMSCSDSWRLSREYIDSAYDINRLFDIASLLRYVKN